MWKTIIGAVLLLAMGVCSAATKDSAVAPATPAGFAEQRAAAAITADSPVAKWWTTLNDPELSHLLQRAINSNLDLRAARARLLEARAGRRSAKADLLPSLDATTSFNRQRGGFENENIHVGNIGANAAGGQNVGGIFVAPFETNLFQVGFDASWEIDFFGGRRHELEAATADVRASEDDSRDVLVSLLAECARNYLELRGTQRRVAIARANIKLQGESLHLTEVRAEAGLGTELDVEREREQLATTQASLPALESASRQTIYALSVLINEQPATLVEELENAKPLPLTPPVIPVGLPAELLQRRPDLRRAQAQVIAAAARVGQARADLFPKVVLSGLAGRQATEFSQFTFGAGNFFSLGPQLSLPVFTGGRIRANIQVQKQRLEQSSIAYRSAILNAMREVEDSLNAFGSERQRREKLAIAVESGQRTTTLATELYERGLSDFLDVLDAQRTQLQAEDALAQSDTAVLTDLVALYKSLGGGWQ